MCYLPRREVAVSVRYARQDIDSFCTAQYARNPWLANFVQHGICGQDTGFQIPMVKTRGGEERWRVLQQVF
jgi:hypothetical protein